MTSGRAQALLPHNDIWFRFPSAATDGSHENPAAEGENRRFRRPDLGSSPNRNVSKLLIQWHILALVIFYTVPLFSTTYLASFSTGDCNALIIMDNLASPPSLYKGPMSGKLPLLVTSRAQPETASHRPRTSDLPSRILLLACQVAAGSGLAPRPAGNPGGPRPASQPIQLA